VQPINASQVGRRAGRRGPGGLLVVAGAAALVVLAVVVWRQLPRPPPPSAWNQLAGTLIADEFHGDTRWNPVLMANDSTPRTPDRVWVQFRSTVDSLDGRWFQSDWSRLTPGQLPPLKVAAKAYAQVYRYAHTAARITPAFDGRSLPVAETIATPSEQGWLLGQLARLSAHLSAASAPWTGVKPAPTGADADRLRALLAAHAELAAAETALLQFAVDHPDAPLIVAGPDGATPLTGRGAVSPEVQALLSNRTQAVADLRQAEAGAQKN
jgi:hypothetical protein